jgi:hypothetical protein
MAIKVKKVPIKAYNSIRKVEQYYIPLHHIYKIISLKLKGVSKKLILQITIKTINNSISLNRLIPTLLVFSTCP